MDYSATTKEDTSDRKRVRRRIHRREAITTKWKQIMKKFLSPHLYAIRVATKEQLARLYVLDAPFIEGATQWKTVEATLWNVWRKLSQVSSDVVKGMQNSTYLYTPEEGWKQEWRHNVYGLRREQALELEEVLGNEYEHLKYYTNSENAELIPRKPFQNRFLLLTELYVRMKECGMDAVGLSWMPNIEFETFVGKLAENYTLDKFRFNGGLKYDTIGEEGRRSHAIGLGINTYEKERAWA